MKREIKFRGQRIGNNELVYGDLIHGVGWKKDKMYILPVVHNLASLPAGCDPLDGYEVKPETVGQLAGLKDKNNIDIYEGDIVAKYYKDTNSQEFQEWVDNHEESLDEGFGNAVPTLSIKDEVTLEHFRYWLKNESFGYDGENLESPDEWEVIGNIYQNPELISPK